MRQINGKTAAHRHFFSFFLYFIVDLRLSAWPNRLIVLKFWAFFLFSSRFPYFMLISEKRAVMIQTDARMTERGKKEDRWQGLESRLSECVWCRIRRKQRESLSLRCLNRRSILMMHLFPNCGSKHSPQAVTFPLMHGTLYFRNRKSS